MKTDDSSRKSRKSLLKLLLVLLLIAVVLIGLYVALRNSEWWEIFSSSQALQDYVRGFGAWAPAVFMLLQVVQVIVSPIPGNITTLAGGALFGFWPAILYSTIAIFIGSLIAFGIGKSCGRPLIRRLVSDEIADKYLKVLAGKQRLTLALMFLFPFFPDDALCLLAGLSGYSWSWFAVMILLTRPWGLVFSALLGSGSLSLPLWGWILLILAAGCAMVLSVKYGSRLEDFLLSKIQSLREKHKKP